MKKLLAVLVLAACAGCELTKDEDNVTVNGDYIEVNGDSNSAGTEKNDESEK